MIADPGDAALQVFSGPPVQATPWDAIAMAILNALFPFAVYEPMTGAPVLTRNGPPRGRRTGVVVPA